MLPDSQMVWGAVSRANRRPSRLEDDLVLPGVLVGSDDFLPEALLAYEAGYRMQPRRGLSFDATAFRHNFSDLRSVDALTGGAAPLILANSFEGHSHGVEFGITLEPVPAWQTHVGYTWLDSEVTSRPGSRVVSAGASEANDPHHLFGLRTSIDLRHGIELDGWVRTVGPLHTPPVPGYTALGLRAGWRASRRVEVFITGQNLLDPSHAEFGADVPTRIEIERSVRAGITLRY